MVHINNNNTHTRGCATLQVASTRLGQAGSKRSAGPGVRSMCLLGALAAMVLALSSTPLVAQVSNLDPAPLIDAMAKEGMSELLLHMVQTEPSDDPVIDRQIKVAQYRIQYQDLSEQAGAIQRSDPQAAAQLSARSLEAFDNMLDAQRQLISDFNSHEQRPIWQTDLAEMLLVLYLQGVHQYAAQFYCLGVPTTRQHEAFEAAVVEALEATSDGDLTFFQLEGTLSREPDHAQKRVNTGLWTRMIDEYWKKRTQYYLANAAYYVAQLPDTHPYFAALGKEKNPRIVEQEKTPAAERKRLLELAVSKIEPFVVDMADDAGLRDTATVLTAQALAGLGQLDEAEKLFDKVIGLRQTNLPNLEAQLGKAVLLFGARQRHSVALDILASLEDHSLVGANILYRLLVTDATHRLLLAKADQADAETRAQAVAAAYQPYLNLLQDRSLGASAPTLTNFIYSRWEQNLDPSTRLNTLPAVVRMGIGQIARQEGQNLDIQAQQSGDAALKQEAQKKLHRAIEVNQTLVDAAISEPVRATGMYNLAVAQYLLEPQDLANLLEVSGILTDLADQMSSQPVAEEAIANAVNLLQAVHREAPGAPGVAEGYRHAAQVLFAKFPISAAADNERVYYAFYVLQRAGQYAQAAEMYGKLVPGHEQYFEAQRELLFCLDELARQAQGAQAQATAVDKTILEARRVRREAQLALGSAQSDLASSAQRAAAGANIVLASMAKAQGQTDQALNLLSNFEQDYASEPALVRLALEQRILVFIDAERFEDAADQAGKMMQAFPDDAAAVIDQVLTNLDSEISRLRSQAAATNVARQRQEALGKAQGLAKTASTLADMLVQWATEQGYDQEQMLAFNLIHIRSLRLAGFAQEAVKRCGPLMDAFPDDVGVLSELADSLFASGIEQADQATQEETLIQAAGYYNQLITGLGEPYPSQWWNAWMRRLQINEKLNQYVEDIALSVRQLRLTDSNLGGPAFKRELERLERKYAPE